jgi:hypothetical protein
MMKEITLEIHGVLLKSFLHIPKGAKSFVIFSHGSGSSRHSVRNQAVARHFIPNMI